MSMYMYVYIYICVHIIMYTDSRGRVPLGSFGRLCHPVKALQGVLGFFAPKDGNAMRLKPVLGIRV